MGSWSWSQLFLTGTDPWMLLNMFSFHRYQLPKVAGPTYSLLAMYLSFSGFQIFTHSCYCKCPPFSHSGRYVICCNIHSVFNLHFLMSRCWWRQQVGKGERRKVHYRQWNTKRLSNSQPGAGPCMLGIKVNLGSLFSCVWWCKSQWWESTSAEDFLCIRYCSKNVPGQTLHSNFKRLLS